jgi:hypothetical protein
MYLDVPLYALFIGYKLRTHISKALKARSKAIQRALVAYNQAASTLDPPRPKLTWVQIVEYTSIAEFELLRTGAREDIRNLDWADARNRQATICYLKMTRAREEIQRLNIETKRLATWIQDEALELDQAIKACRVVDPPLSQAVTKFANQRKRVNTNLEVTLRQVYALQGYSGEAVVGTQELEEQELGNGSSDEGTTDHEDVEEVLDQVFEGITRLTLDG